MRRGDDRVDPGEKFVLEMDDGGDVSVTLSGTSHVIKFAISRGPVRGTASHIKIRVPVFLLLISRERLNLTFPIKTSAQHPIYGGFKGLQLNLLMNVPEDYQSDCQH